MKKETIKKVIKAKVATKKVTAKKKTEAEAIAIVEDILNTPTICVACSGSGLERPTFTNSALCQECNGAGII